MHLAFIHCRVGSLNYSKGFGKEGLKTISFALEGFTAILARVKAGLYECFKV